MDFCRDEDSCSTESIWSSSSGHPASVHWLDESDGCVFDLLELVSKLKFAAESVDEEGGVDDRDVDIFDKDLGREDLEHLSDFEHVNLDSVREINQEVGALLDPTRHIQTRCCYDFGVPALGKAFEVLLVLGYRGYFVVVVAHVPYLLIDV